MSSIYQRPELARQMAEQLLHPGVLNEGLRSGLFLSGLRRTGKTTFLVRDLIPALAAAGAIVVYVDLWSDVNVQPSELVRRAVRSALQDLQSPVSTLLQKLRRVTQVKLDTGAGLKFSFDLDKLGQPEGATLAQAFTEVVDQAAADVVLIVDEIQQTLSTEEGGQLMLALKATRDAINYRPETPGHFLLIGAGSHSAMVGELVTRKNQAFAGATSIDYPLLGSDYVAYVLARLAEGSHATLPSNAAAWQAFTTLGNRPEELLKALRILHSQQIAGQNIDSQLRIIAATLRISAAEAELLRLDQLGALAGVIFGHIAQASGAVKGIFSADAAARYTLLLGREVRIEEIQAPVNSLIAANLLIRRGHGAYEITDPFVKIAWQEQRQLTQF